MTARRSTSDTASEEQFGRRMRELRAERDMTLQELADLSGVSVSMISQVERGRRIPTLPVAQKLVDGLGLRLADVLDGAPEGMTGVRRSEEMVDFLDRKTGTRRTLLSRSLPPSQVEVSWYRLPAGSGTGPFLHASPTLVEEVTVLRGRLQVTVGGDVHVLRAGDAITYRGTTEHRFDNVGGSECSYIHIGHHSGRGVAR